MGALNRELNLTWVIKFQKAMSFCRGLGGSQRMNQIRQLYLWYPVESQLAGRLGVVVGGMSWAFSDPVI